MATDCDIRVLSVCTSDTHGGAARAANRIHQGVRSLGVDSRMFVKNKGSQDPNVHTLAEFVPNNFMYNVLDWCANKVKNKIQHYYWNQYPNKDVNYKSDLRGTRLHGALQSWEYDVLHLHWINERFINIDELRKVHKPIVWTLHDSWPFCGVCHYFLNCEGYQYQCGNCPQLGSNNPNDLSHLVWQRKADVFKDLDLHIVSPSKWLADCALQSALFKGRDIRVVPNGLDTESFRPLAIEEIRLIAERQQNAVVGRVLREATQEKGPARPLILFGAMHAANDRIKGFASLLSALRMLDAQGFNANLVVFGAEAQELPMQFKNIDVTFVGYIRDTAVLTALYTIADVMAVPSFSEVFGQTASEAMACATPVVAFRCTGIQDVVEEGCGYLAEPYSSEDLANGIRYCIEHNSDNVLGKNARKSVERRYAMEVVAKQYAELYRSL